MTTTLRSSTGVAYDRAGPRGGLPVVLVHAGVADRRMWDTCWPGLTADHDAVRLDLRGFGDTTARPPAQLAPVADLADTLVELGIRQCHLVGASMGAGVCVELALTQPEQVRSLFLLAPGGSLIADLTPDLQAFIEAERSALGRGDLESAVEANLSLWVDGPAREAEDVPQTLRALVGQMQRHAFEVTADWDDIEEHELDPPALDRLTEIQLPTLILVGGLDVDAIQTAAHQLTNGIAGARLVEWPGTAHLPSMERPDAFLALLRTWLAEVGSVGR